MMRETTMDAMTKPHRLADKMAEAKAKGNTKAKPASKLGAPKAGGTKGHRQRMFTRIDEREADSLNDYELLEVLLFFIHRQKDTKPDAKLLLQFDDNNKAAKTLGEVFASDPKQLLEVDGIGPNAVRLIKLVDAIAKRIGDRAVIGASVFDTWEDIIRFCRTTIGHSKKELFMAIYLNAKNHLIKYDYLAEGTLDRVSVYPREVLKKTLASDAATVILVHNHPSGVTEPSSQDIEVTKRVVAALRTIDVTLLDHIIISGADHFSFKNEGLLT